MGSLCSIMATAPSIPPHGADAPLSARGSICRSARYAGWNPYRSYLSKRRYHQATSFGAAKPVPVAGSAAAANRRPFEESRLSRIIVLIKSNHRGNRDTKSRAIALINKTATAHVGGASSIIALMPWRHAGINQLKVLSIEWRSMREGDQMGNIARLGIGCCHVMRRGDSMGAENEPE